MDIKVDDKDVAARAEDADEADEHPQPFEMDEMACEDESHAAAPADESTVATDQDAIACETPAHKLDLMMNPLFAFIKHECRDRSDMGQQQADHLFRAMMRIFNSIIMTTYAVLLPSLAFVFCDSVSYCVGTNQSSCNI
eukprot:COSAG01_NODE_7676_length_3103_cov_1.446072_3_plen_139_part_00